MVTPSLRLFTFKANYCSIQTARFNNCLNIPLFAKHFLIRRRIEQQKSGNVDRNDLQFPGLDLITHLKEWLIFGSDQVPFVMTLCNFFKRGTRAKVLIKYPSFYHDHSPPSSQHLSPSLQLQ